MPIEKDHINFSPSEYLIKIEHIFFEKSISPSSTDGSEINNGFLLLTNKRLFFFHTGIGPIRDEFAEIKKHLEIISTLSQFIPIGNISNILDMGKMIFEYGHNKYKINKIKNDLSYLQMFLDKRNSFVINLDTIKSCSLFRNSFKPFVNMSPLKKFYVRIGIENYDLGEPNIDFYCIYSLHPNHGNRNRTIKFEKWYKEIKRVAEKCAY